VAVGDFNEDGIPDLVTATNGATSSVTILSGRGDGTFVPSATIAVGRNVSFVATGHLTTSGHLDLVVADSSNIFPGVWVLLGHGDGTFSAPVEYVTGLMPTSVAIGDLDGDGIPDLVVADSGRLANPQAGFCILRGNGDGTFQPAVTTRVGTMTNSVAIQDFNGDGTPDLVVTSSGNLFFGYQGSINIFLGNAVAPFLALPLAWR
jgi:hypothetical protein